MASRFSLSVVSVLGGLVACASSAAAEALPVGRLIVAPAEIELHEARRPHGLLVTAVTPGGRQVDVTARARFESDRPQNVRVDEKGMCHPLADGEATVRIHFGGRSATVGVRVKGMGQPAPPSFVNDIEPVLTRYGCNQGGCHGKSTGQNGFMLSLRGFAPELDYDWITRQHGGRRVSLQAPRESLIVRKALGEAPHEGGKIFGADHAAAHMLIDWVAAGAKGLSEADVKLERLELLPADRVLRLNQTQRLLARAHWSNGRVEDVTWLTQFFSSDPSTVAVGDDGAAAARRAGAATVRAHFQDCVETVTFTIPYENDVQDAWYAEHRNAVDRHVFEKMKRLRVPPSPGSDDATFLRRAMLDTIGTLPTPDEVKAFVQDKAPDKRARLVDRLLERPEYVDFWTLQLGDLLQNRRERDHDVRGTKGVRAFHAWLRRQVAANRPWDQLVREVLTAAGDSRNNPQIGYYVVTVGEAHHPEKSEVVASAAQAFLGTQIGCAQCHNHPSEKYTQDDYYHFAAFFTKMSFDRKNPAEGDTSLRVKSREQAEHEKRLGKKREELKALEAQPKPGSDEEAKKREKQLKHKRKEVADLERRVKELAERMPRAHQPRTHRMLEPRPLDRAEVKPGDDPRAALVAWMIDPNNEYFSGAMVNRLWKHFMFTGLVEPVDDLRPSNPPSNRALWDALRTAFVRSGYDLKHVMRLILNSRAYQLSSETRPGNENDLRFHSHYYARRLSAEVMADAVSRVTGVPDKFAGYPVGMRAIQLPDPGVESYFLSMFGRSERVTACACERDGAVTLPQLMHMRNSENIQHKIRHDGGRLSALLKAEADDGRVVDALFVATLGRGPRAEERRHVLAERQKAEDRTDYFRDLLWALLNTKEFAFNH